METKKMLKEASTPFTITLLRWYEQNGRQLPWRATRDAYAIWLSEIILQQTRVQQGLSYWERFMQRWPTVEQLASATEDEVLRLWQGLGYYSRARNLHAAAKQIVAMGGFPQTAEELRRLKGVGDYTAAAIASVAFGQPVAVVDGNVYRVLARYFGIDTPINTTRAKREFGQLAQSQLPPRHAALWNQAIMDFGALQCTPQSPHCDGCPLAITCTALREDKVALLPRKLKKREPKTRRLTYIYIRCNGQTALRRRGPGDIWQGLWEPVLMEDCAEWNEDIAGWNGARLTLLRKDVKHVLTHRILMADFYLLETDTQLPLPPDYQWVSEQDIDRYALPRLIELLLESLPPSAAG